MVVSNCPASHVARCGRNLAVAADTLCDRGSPCHVDIREDGTFAGLEDDKEDATGNPRALVPCNAQPDPVVGQRAVIPCAGRMIVPHQTGHNADRPQESVMNTFVQTRATPQVSFREAGTIAGLESDEEDGNDSKGNHPKSQTTVTTAAFGAECVSEAQGTQGSEHQDKEEACADPQDADPKRGAIVDPQDDPQDVDLERGAIIDPQVPDLEVDPQDPDPEGEVQVNPQPLPALSLKTVIPIDGIDEANEHETDKQSHLNHDPETQIQVPGPEVPNNWRAPTASHVQRELGNSMVLLSMGCAVWRPSNPRGAPEFDENGVLLGIESDDEDCSRPQGS